MKVWKKGMGVLLTAMMLLQLGQIPVWAAGEEGIFQSESGETPQEEGVFEGTDSDWEVVDEGDGLFAEEEEAPQEQTAEASWQTAENGEWQSGSFENAIENVYAGGTVKLQKDVFLTKRVVVEKAMTITSENAEQPVKITCTVNGHEYLLYITGSDVVLKDIIVDGGSAENISAQRALIAVNGETGKLTLERGAVIQNNQNVTTRGAGGGIALVTGSLVMKEGAAIQSCQADFGGGIAIVNSVSNQFTMEGGIISKNSSVYPTEDNSYVNGGGGIYQATGVVTLQKGEISGNKAVKGGGVFLASGATVLEEGEIVNNEATQGGGVYLYQANAIFQMDGGSIKGNHAQDAGGIFGNRYQGMYLYGGNIVENIATAYGGGILTAPSGSIYLKGKIRIAENQSGSEIITDNFYIDSYTDENGKLQKAEVVVDGSLEGAMLGLSSWAKPEEGGKLLLISAGTGYTITQSDYAVFTSDDMDYELLLEENSIYMTKAIPAPPTPADPAWSVNASLIDYEKETVKLPNGLFYQLGANGEVQRADGQPVSLKDILSEEESQVIYWSGIYGIKYSLTIPARPAAPSLTPVAETGENKKDGQLLGVTSQMEYRRQGEQEWIPVTGNQVTNLEPGTYEVRYRAVKGASFAGSITTVTIDAYEKPILPGTVILKATTNTTTTIKLDWTKVEGAQGYTIWYRAKGESSYTRAAIKKGQDTLTHIMKGLTPGTTYYFLAKAWSQNEDGTYLFSALSNRARRTARPLAAVIQEVTQTVPGKVKVRLEGPAFGADHYAICYSRSADFVPYKVGIRTQYTVRTMADTLGKGTWYIKVRSYCQLPDGTRVYGDWSDSAEIHLS